MDRLTARNEQGQAYLANVKDNEQEIEGSRNTLQCVYDSWQRLAAYEDLGTVEECAAAVAAWNTRPAPVALSLEELVQMDGEPVWVDVLDTSPFADERDAFSGWGSVRKSWVRIWDRSRGDLIHIDHDFENYGKTWLAYAARPAEQKECEEQ